MVSHPFRQPNRVCARHPRVTDEYEIPEQVLYGILGRGLPEPAKGLRRIMGKMPAGPVRQHRHGLAKQTRKDAFLDWPSFSSGRLWRPTKLQLVRLQ